MSKNLVLIQKKNNGNFNLDLAPTDSAAGLPGFKFPRPGPENSVKFITPRNVVSYPRWKRRLAHFQLLNKQLLQRSFSPDQLLSVRLHIYIHAISGPLQLVCHGLGQTCEMANPFLGLRLWLFNACFLLGFVFSSYVSSLNTTLVAFLVLRDIFLGICPVEGVPHLHKVNNEICCVLAWSWVADADPQEDERLEQQHLGFLAGLVNCEKWVTTKCIYKWRSVKKFKLQLLQD